MGEGITIGAPVTTFGEVKFTGGHEQTIVAVTMGLVAGVTLGRRSGQLERRAITRGALRKSG